MTDATPPPDPDDVLRSALQAEADGIEASDALLDRTLTAAARPPVRAGRRLLAVAAVVAAVAVGAGVALARDDDQQVDSANDPSPTVTSEPATASEELADLLSGVFTCDNSILTVVVIAPEATGAEQAAIVATLTREGSAPVVSSREEVRARLLDRYAEDEEATRLIEASDIPSAALTGSMDPDAELAMRGEVSDLAGVQQVISTDCREQPAPPSGERPTQVALVREDGWLVVIDLVTDEERELHFGGDPEAPPSGQEEGGPQFIDSVDLSPDGGWVYFSTCCEPAAGVTYRIPITGGAPEQFAFGAYPRVSPDGRFVATSHGVFVAVTPTDGGEPVLSEQVECCPNQLAWSPDGRQLAAVQSPGPDGQVHEVLLFDWDGASLTPADPGKPDNPGNFVAWDPNGTLTTISGGGSTSSSRSLSQDVSYLWLIWVDADGVVREQASLHSGELPAIAGLPEALSADW